LIYSRLEQGMKSYDASHPGTDILLFEPDQRDPEMFLANTFGYSQRRTLAEHAYQRHAGRPALAAQRDQRHAGSPRPDPGRCGAGRSPSRAGAPRRRPRTGTRVSRALKRLDEVLNDLDKALAARS
jgi:NTE family protein